MGAAIPLNNFEETLNILLGMILAVFLGTLAGGATVLATRKWRERQATTNNHFHVWHPCGCGTFRDVFRGYRCTLNPRLPSGNPSG